MDSPTLICARLLRAGAVPRAELPDLDFPEVRREVEHRLAAVGLTLATSAYSEHVGIRLSSEITADAAFDSASNLGLRADACALLVILWARLVLQKRTAADTRELPGQGALWTGEQASAARDYRPSVRLEALVREFRAVLGGRSRILSLVTQLRRLHFLAGHGEVIEAGPLLELGIDGERMIGFIRREVLAQLVAEREGAASAKEEAGEEMSELAARALTALARLGGTAAISELERATGEKRERLRPVLKSLAEAGRLYRSGERGSARYHLIAETGEGMQPAEREIDTGTESLEEEPEGVS
jgi:DNA-binding MarR family transcriptional regulator